MLYEVLRIVAYLSILTATSSSYLTKESLVNYRRASPSSIPNDHLAELSYDGEGLEWTDLNVEPSQPDYLIPQLVNTNNMLYTQLSRSNSNMKNQKKINTRKLNHRMRGKKDNNKLVTSKNNNKLTNLIKNYDNTNKRNNIANSVRSESNNDKNVSEKMQMLENDSKINFTNKSVDISQTSHYQSPSAISNEFPNSQISPENENEHNRELQQLFGIEGAKKFQSYQLQQQLLNKNEEYTLKPNDEGVEIKEPQRKRNDELNGEEVQDVQGSMANQLMPRTTRRQREYDVPLIRKFNF
jgi:hypothetical protein